MQSDLINFKLQIQFNQIWLSLACERNQTQKILSQSNAIQCIDFNWVSLVSTEFD